MGKWTSGTLSTGGQLRRIRCWTADEPASLPKGDSLDYDEARKRWSRAVFLRRWVWSERASHQAYAFKSCTCHATPVICFAMFFWIQGCAIFKCGVFIFGFIAENNSIRFFWTICYLFIIYLRHSILAPCTHLYKEQFCSLLGRNNAKRSPSDKHLASQCWEWWGRLRADVLSGPNVGLSAVCRPIK